MGEFMAPIVPIPAYTQALQDRGLRGNARDVYLWLCDRLDICDYRPIKHTVAEVDLGMNRVSVARAIQRLLDDGYVARGAREGRLWTYRLTYSRPDKRFDGSQMLPVDEQRQ
jgi:hypothetical protein